MGSKEWIPICPLSAPNHQGEIQMKNFWKIAALLLLAASTNRPAHAEDPFIPGPNSFVRILHAVTGGPKVDVYIDGDKQLNDVEFSAITKYLRVSSGRHSFRIDTNNPSRTLVNFTHTLRNGDFYTVAAFGTPARPILRAFNDSTGMVPFNRSRITFYNLSTGGPSFDVRATIKQNGDMLRIARGVRFGQGRAAITPALPQSLRLLAGSRTLKTITGAEPRAGRKYAAYAVGRVERNYKVMLVNAASQ
jgi:hypothetical protein